MKVFISYHRADTKARDHIEDLLKDNDISSNYEVSSTFKK